MPAASSEDGVHVERRPTNYVLSLPLIARRILTFLSPDARRCARLISRNFCNQERLTDAVLDCSTLGISIEYGAGLSPEENTSEPRRRGLDVNIKEWCKSYIDAGSRTIILDEESLTWSEGSMQELAELCRNNHGKFRVTIRFAHDDGPSLRIENIIPLILRCATLGIPISSMEVMFRVWTSSANYYGLPVFPDMEQLSADLNSAWTLNATAETLSWHRSPFPVTVTLDSMHWWNGAQERPCAWFEMLHKGNNFSDGVLRLQWTCFNGSPVNHVRLLRYSGPGLRLFLRILGYRVLVQNWERDRSALPEYTVRFCVGHVRSTAAAADDDDDDDDDDHDQDIFDGNLWETDDLDHTNGEECVRPLLLFRRFCGFRSNNFTFEFCDAAAMLLFADRASLSSGFWNAVACPGCHLLISIGNCDFSSTMPGDVFKAADALREYVGASTVGVFGLASADGVPFEFVGHSTETVSHCSCLSFSDHANFLDVTCATANQFNFRFCVSELCCVFHPSGMKYYPQLRSQRAPVCTSIDFRDLSDLLRSPIAPMFAWMRARRRFPTEEPLLWSVKLEGSVMNHDDKWAHNLANYIREVVEAENVLWVRLEVGNRVVGLSRAAVKGCGDDTLTLLMTSFRIDECFQGDFDLISAESHQFLAVQAAHPRNVREQFAIFLFQEHFDTATAAGMWDLRPLEPCGEVDAKEDDVFWLFSKSLVDAFARKKFLSTWSGGRINVELRVTCDSQPALSLFRCAEEICWKIELASDLASGSRQLSHRTCDSILSVARELKRCAELQWVDRSSLDDVVSFCRKSLSGEKC
jgi:hypothetical protein